jgi:predicted metal-dependent HD superfamily phosphohydrolase
LSTREAALERWRETWELAGAPPPAGAFDDLFARYAEPHRAYHDLGHVLSCLRHAADVRARLTSPAEVELALWYHDAVYDPHRGDNEAASARLAGDRLAPLLAPASVAAIEGLVLATRHLAVPEGDDARFLVDIDLAILGATPEAFDAYETAVRR